MSNYLFTVYRPFFSCVNFSYLFFRNALPYILRTKDEHPSLREALLSLFPFHLLSDISDSLQFYLKTAYV